MPPPRLPDLAGRVIALSLALAVASCASNPLRRTGEVPKKLSSDEVPAAIEQAEQAFEAGRIDLALEWAYAASRVEGLPTEQRNRAQSLMEQAADARIAQLSGEGGDPEELADLIDVGLPRQVAVSAGIRAAELWIAQGEYKRAFALIQRLDELYPWHHERPTASALVAECGIQLSHMDTGWWIFGRSRPKAFQALEYLVLTYPQEARAAEAYWRLGEMYEEDSEWETAVDRLTELVIYHPRSPFTPRALARIPHVRLASIESPEYDRKELTLARDELEQWLRLYPAHELEVSVREDLDDCMRRLAQSDLVIARFYRTVGNDHGTRLHAERALEEARLAGDADRERSAELMLAALGPVQAEPEEANVLLEAPVPEDARGEAVRE